MDSAQGFTGQLELTAHYATLQDQTARNRINQRNFRSRRQQYTKELEEKLRAYDQAGVQATSQVQMAARVVARENVLLRNLVREMTGCSEQQLNSYLSSALRPGPERAGETRAFGPPLPRIETSPSLLPSADKKESPVAQSHLEPDYVSGLGQSGSAAPNPLPRPYVGTDPRCHNNHNPYLPSDKVLADSNGSESVDTSYNPKLESHRSFDSGSTGVRGKSSEFNKQQGPSMSCEEAAAIISSIGIIDGPRDIREQLGCTSVGTCNVNNMEVFQVMEEAI